MIETIIVALLSLIGTCIGSIAGVMTANKMAMYRIEQLERKVEKHNNVVERTTVLEQKMTVANHRIKDLEEDFQNV